MRSDRSAIVILLITIAGLILLRDLWGLGLMLSDDAMWHLWAYQQDKNPPLEWAIHQGRLYALVAGPIMLHVLSWTGTWVGEVLKLAPFLLAVVLYGFAVRAYFGLRLGLLSTALFIALFAVRFDGSAATTYPMLLWPFMAACLIALLISRFYSRHGGGPSTVIAYAGLLLLSLFTNEATALTFVGLAVLAWVGNVALHERTAGPIWSRIDRRDWILAIATIAPVLFYGLAYLAFRWWFPTSYDGLTLTFSEPLASLRTWLVFTLNGSILFSFLDPYRIAFAEPTLSHGYKAVYSPIVALSRLWASPLALVYGGLCGAAVAMILKTAPAQVQGKPQPARPAVLNPLLGVLPGLVTATSATLPVALSVKYISWHENQGVDSYVTTVLSHFGVTLILASILLFAFDAIRKSPALKVGTLLMAGLVGVLAAATQYLNVKITEDIRLEGLRWQAFGSALETADRAGLRIEVATAPQFWRGSWYSVVSPEYWADLAKAKHAHSLAVIKRPLQTSELNGAAEILYFADRGRRRSNVVVGRFAGDADGTPIFDKIAVGLAENALFHADGLVLGFYDRQLGPRQVPIALLERVPGKRPVFQLSGVKAVPGTVQLVDQTVSPGAQLSCGEQLKPPVEIEFGVSLGSAPRECNGGTLLGAGWGAPEAQGVWSATAHPTVHLRLDGGVSGAMALKFDMDTLTSLNFAPGAQIVRVSVNDASQRIWSFEAGKEQPQPLVLQVPADPGSQALKIAFEIDRPMQPSKLGIGADERELGVFLRSITIERAQQ